MLYMVELRYAEEYREAALAYFWKHGSTLYEAKVTVQEVWVATEDPGCIRPGRSNRSGGDRHSEQTVGKVW